MDRSSRCLVGALAVSLSLHFAQTACAARTYVGLRGRNEPALRALLAAQQDPTGPEYRHWIGAQEFGRRFGAAPRDLKRVERWLRSPWMTMDAKQLTWRNTTVIMAIGLVLGAVYVWVDLQLAAQGYR